MRVIYCGKESAWQGRMFLLPRDMMGRLYRARGGFRIVGSCSSGGSKKRLFI
jgi:hypothetical protein